jgi:hypothetical protein
MALIPQNLEKLDLLSFHPVSARTATGEATGVDLRQYDGDVVLILDSAAAGAGTNPTLDVTVEHSDSLSTDYTAITGAAFTQVTDAASRQKLVIDVDGAKRYVRVKYTIGGTSSPSFTFSVTGVGVKKYG